MEAAAGDDRRRRREEGLRPAGRGAGRGHVAARARPSRRRPTSSPRAPASVPQRRSIWPAIHPRLLELVRAHRSTILFVNSRRLAERLAAALNELAGEEIARAHHGSIAREQRLQIEDALKAGRLPALVATSSLELGHRHGRGRPRGPDRDAALGRERHAAHRPRQPPGRGRLARRSSSRSTAATSWRRAAITRAMKEGAVEETRVPAEPARRPRPAARGDRSPLGERKVDELYALVRRAAPFSELAARAVRGRARHALGPLPVRRVRRAAAARHLGPAARRRARARGRAAAGRRQRRHDPRPRPLRRLPRRRPRARAARVGELDEEMVFESRAGEVFVLGASSWRIVEITRDRVLVAPAPGEPGQDAVLEGRPRRRGRSSWAARSAADARARWRCRATRRSSGSQREHDLDALRRAEPARLPRRPARGDGRPARRPHASSSSARATRWGTGGCACSRPGAAASTRRGRSRSRRGCGSAGEAEVETIWSDDGIVLRLPERERPPEAADAPARARGDRGPGGARAAGARASSPPASARRRPARCSCRGAGRASARRCGCSGSARTTCCRWPRATPRSRSCSRPTASACRTSSTCRRSSSSPAACGGARSAS